MARVAPRVPELSDVLCERCGYVLNGLPTDGRCPECGKPIAESVGTDRLPTPWDVSANPGPNRTTGFIRTCLAVIRRPAHFYRTLATRGSLSSARTFAHVNWWIAGGLFGVAGATHSMWYWSSYSAMRPPPLSPAMIATWLGFTVGLAILTYLALDGITRLASHLTTWEGTYRGYRLPYDVVLRGLYYHSPHYLPVAAMTAATVVGYQLLVAVHTAALASAVRYLIVLCVEVVVGAIYLFQTYWIGMRNMMYANR
jgi:hypothetical protein